MEKEYLYVGFYRDINDKIILKIGTTNDLKRRSQEHTRNYRRAKQYTMPADSEFQYLWHCSLSKYNTLRYEDSNRALWIKNQVGEFIRNDRFLLNESIDFIEIKIRKTYKIALNFAGRFFFSSFCRFSTLIGQSAAGAIMVISADFQKSQVFSKKIFKKFTIILHFQIFPKLTSPR